MTLASGGGGESDVPACGPRLAKFDWKVVAQWATKDINLVAQQ